ncbi:hypothetical protein [Kitasatospora viridis]|uniref:Uncharacterized protein n=1 Tax=Kitasatospora viridis TaxID=281105 RepID=A0A561S9A6_9ACTN|nr:hypothetical protein [Kitasatospora viridis]TWF71452.1 hypothetical protein FHX73_1982 [Kitasatospora viridis]
MTRRHTTIGAGLLAVVLAGGVGLAVQANASGERSANTPSQTRAIPGYQVVRLGNANVGNFERRTVYCPAGKKAIGGGAEARGNDSILNGSFPTDNNDGWIGVGHQPGAGSVGISVFAICADA